MTKPSNFILSSDYSTLKNDDTNSVSIVIPGSIVIPASGTYSYSASANLTIGSIGSLSRTQVNTSRNATDWYFTPLLQIFATGTGSLSGTIDYDYFVYITRTSATTVTANVLIQNDSFPAETLTTESTARTITFKVATFLPPFTT